MIKTPTDIHPGLTEARLIKIGSIIRAARHQAVLDHKPSLGDDGWVLGCRCYRWECFGVMKAVPENADWLSLVDGGVELRDGRLELSGLRFTFAIAGVPLRFYRGSAEDVPSRSLRRSYAELESHQQAFAFVDEPVADACLRLAIETDDLGEVDRIVLVQVDAEGNPINEGWTIPEIEERPSKVVKFPRAEGSGLRKPDVGSKKKDSKHATDDTDENA